MAELYQGLEGEEFGEGERGAPGAGNRRPGFRRAWAGRRPGPNHWVGGWLDVARGLRATSVWIS